MKKIILGLFIVLGTMSLFIIGTDSDAKEKCTMDIQCGVGKKCVSGVCAGGIVPKIKGKCVRGRFGKKVCDNTGEECSNDSECWK